jgi:hypothetical protein
MASQSPREIERGLKAGFLAVVIVSKEKDVLHGMPPDRDYPVGP